VIKPTDTPYYRDGFYWHSRCTGYEAHYINTAGSHVARVAQHVPAGRRVAIQAGGHVGLWALQLAHLFENVYTFEPDADNFRCLVLNASLWNIYPYRAMLGNVPGPKMFLIGPESGRGQTGLSVVHTDPQLAVATEVCFDVPTLLIDNLGLYRCDLICLDIEGYETPALLGAEATIKKFSPIIMTERTGKVSADENNYNHETTHRLLMYWGYRQVDQIDKDVIWARS